MNIKNKPFVEIHKNDQKVVDLHRQVEFLQQENEFFKTQLGNLVGLSDGSETV